MLCWNGTAEVVYIYEKEDCLIYVLFHAVVGMTVIGVKPGTYGIKQ